MSHSWKIICDSFNDIPATVERIARSSAHVPLDDYSKLYIAVIYSLAVYPEKNR